MQRHLILKRQQQRFSLGRHLLKSRPLVERSIRQRRLLANLLGLQTESALDTALPGTVEAQTWSFVSAEAEPIAIPAEPSTSSTLIENAPESPQQVVPLLPLLPSFPVTNTLEIEGEELLPDMVTIQIESEELLPDMVTIQDEITGQAEVARSRSLTLSEQSEILSDLAEPVLPPAQELVQEQESPANQLLTAQPIQDSLASAEVLKQDLSKETARQPPHAPNGQREKSRESRLPRRARVQEISAGASEISAALPRREIVTSEIIPERQEQVSQEAITQASGLATEAGIAPGNGRGKQSQAPQSTENAGELFAENGSDRSPQAWLARLIRQAERERIQTKTTYGPTPSATNTPVTNVAGKAGRLVPQRRTEPVSQQARTFLKPLVGIDPDEVPIYRDGQAAQLTDELDADALSNGQGIEIAPGYTENTPEALGLLAHELTHVVRRQRPRFIPPVVKAQTVPGGQRQTPGPELLNEEDLALQVEQQVRRVARAVSEVSTLAPRGPAFSAHTPEGEQAASPGESRTERGIWGNLPAPWEPLPAWLTNTPSPAPMSPVPPKIQIISPPTVTWQAPRAGQENTGQTFGETGIRRASTQRNINDSDEEGNTSAQQASEQTVPAQPEADLDALARQVYNLLKRRLSVEQRRVL